MRGLCHLVPIAALASALTGCWVFHGGGGGCTETVVSFCCDELTGVEVSPTNTCPYECPDGARLSSSTCPAPPPDGGRADAGPLDAGSSSLMCTPSRGAAACSNPGVVPAGQAFNLPVDMGTCGCCPRAECAVSREVVDGVPTLRVTTTACPDPCDCLACNPLEAQCPVPALEPGQYNVVVNGAPAYTLWAEPLAPGLVAPPAICTTFAEEDPCQIGERIDPQPVLPDRVCTDQNVNGAALRVELDCPSCWTLLGPCEVRLEPRLTDDLPPGGELFIDPRAHATSCDVICPPSCQRASMTCRVPELMPDGLYRVWFQGRPIGSFVSGSPETCFELDGPVPG